MEIIHWFGNHWSTVPSFQQYHDSRRVPGFLRTCFPDWVVKSAFLSLETFGLAIGIIRAQGCWCPVYFTQYILVKLGIPYIYIYIIINIHVLIYTYTKSKSHIQKALKILCYTLPSFFCPGLLPIIFQHRTFEAPNTKTTLVGSVGESSTGPW